MEEGEPGNGSCWVLGRVQSLHLHASSPASCSLLSRSGDGDRGAEYEQRLLFPAACDGKVSVFPPPALSQLLPVYTFISRSPRGLMAELHHLY